MISKLFCIYPFYYMSFSGTKGDVFCCCDGWVKSPSGNLQDHSLLDIWNGPHYQKIRENLLNGKWEELCNPICPIVCQYENTGKTIDIDALQKMTHISNNVKEEILAGKTVLESTPSVFIFTNSGLCNIQCIMCGWKDVDENPELLNKTYEQVKSLLPEARVLILSGGGDPFVRPDTRAILFGESFEHLKITLITNGLLLSTYWDKIKHHNFDCITISIDAATKETYEKIRVNANWESLLESLCVVAENRNRFWRVELNMTVMTENYKEIPAFIALAKKYGFSASFGRVQVFSKEFDPSQNFFDNNKEILNDFIRVLQSIDPKDISTEAVLLRNLVEFYKPVVSE